MSRHVLLSIMLFAVISMITCAPIEKGVELETRITHTGRGTWFNPGLGNCGQWNNANDPIVAIPKSLYDQNGGSNCGQWIRIVDTNTGAVAYGLTKDSCPTCGSNDLDMSLAVFQRFASLNTGVVPVSWSFLPRGVSPP